MQVQQYCYSFSSYFAFAVLQKTLSDMAELPDWLKDAENNPNQISLFEEKANARHSDPDTSHAAAQSLSSDKLRESQEAVLEHFVEHGPMTDVDLGNVYGGPPRQSPSGLRTRRRELVDRGLMEDTGTRKKLPTGRRGIVWRVKD